MTGFGGNNERIGCRIGQARGASGRGSGVQGPVGLRHRRQPGRGRPHQCRAGAGARAAIAGIAARQQRAHPRHLGLGDGDRRDRGHLHHRADAERRRRRFQKRVRAVRDRRNRPGAGPQARVSPRRGQLDDDAGRGRRANSRPARSHFRQARRPRYRPLLQPGIHRAGQCHRRIAAARFRADRRERRPRRRHARRDLPPHRRPVGPGVPDEFRQRRADQDLGQHLCDHQDFVCQHARRDLRPAVRARTPM